LDVREFLERGIDPFSQIMAARQRLQAGQALHLQAPFEPVPLYQIFASAGYAVEASQDADGVWNVLFTPDETMLQSPLELDLRELQPPEPLIQTLEAAGRLGRGENLIIHTRFRPVHLMEKLADSGFECEPEEHCSGHWISHIWHLTATTTDSGS
jgi:uncharacterized protein (DUF2249 family)